MLDPKETAFIVIDMQGGFIDKSSSLCVAQARASIPSCAKALNAARDMGMMIVHARRLYADDGSDVEAGRYGAWLAGGKPLSAGGANPQLLEVPPELAELPGETVLVKPRYSVFFATGLDALLRERGIRTVVLTGTTTPNCVRSSCFDAFSLNYNVVIVEDATSSRDAATQEANIADMAVMGAQIISSAQLAERGLSGLRDIEAEAHGKA